MKIILNYEPSTGQISDKNGAPLICWYNLEFETVGESSESKESISGVSGEQAIRMMKIAAHVQNPNKVEKI